MTRSQGIFTPENPDQGSCLNLAIVLANFNAHKKNVVFPFEWK